MSESLEYYMRKGGRGSMLERQWTIFSMLRANRLGLAAQQIARATGTPIRTIYRDLEVMSVVLPVYSQRQKTEPSGASCLVWRVLGGELW